MEIAIIIILIVSISIFFLFPMLCALLMRKVCKSFSDLFIIRFIGISCALFTLPKLLDAYPSVEVPNPYLKIGIITFSFLFNYFICQALARAGVSIINKTKSKQGNEAVREEAGENQ